MWGIHLAISEIHRRSKDSPHEGPIMRKTFPCCQHSLSSVLTKQAYRQFDWRISGPVSQRTLFIMIPVRQPECLNRQQASKTKVMKYYLDQIHFHVDFAYVVQAWIFTCNFISQRKLHSPHLSRFHRWWLSVPRCRKWRCLVGFLVHLNLRSAGSVMVQHWRTTEFPPCQTEI